MKANTVYKNARSAVIEIVDGGVYHTVERYELWLNGICLGEIDKTIHKVFGLTPDTGYEVEIKQGNDRLAHTSFRTNQEYVTLDVREFGAKGDGTTDDTLAIQSAIMACPKQGRVLIPEGIYRFVCLFLKDNLVLELGKGAVLKAYTERERFPYYPGKIETTDGTGEYLLGTWEGDPGRMFCGLITGTNVNHVEIYGEGTIDGNASGDNWWHNCKVQNIAWRPRMIFLNHCQDITIMGITVRNSPSWNIHPYFSTRLRFIGLDVLNPKDSPNTDGLDPESCNDVELLGIHFSVGDDCIALKSGKIYMGKTYKTPCENIRIRQCSMNDGHGSITLGSEMGAGIKNITVSQCRFTNTDRGLRIKTRRGRGEDAVIEQVCFDGIMMDGVLTPFVANSFYFCDPDGKSDYVQNRNPLPVDERTPEIKSLIFRNIEARNVHCAAAYLFGLPERKIGLVEMKNVSVSYAKDAQASLPAMMCGVEPMRKAGIIAANIRHLKLKNVTIEGQDGDAVVTDGVDELEQ